MILNPKVGDKVMVCYDDIGRPFTRLPNYNFNSWPYEVGVTGIIIGFSEPVDGLPLLPIPLVRASNPLHGWFADTYMLPKRLERIEDTLQVVGVCRGGQNL
jgi:hypothetical protein